MSNPCETKAKPLRFVVTLKPFSSWWVVFNGFDDQGRVRTVTSPMQEVGRTPEGNIIVIDRRVEA